MSVLTVNCPLVKNNAEFNYCCWMLTNSHDCQTFFKFPCPLLGIVSKQKIVYKWGKECRNHTSEEENTTHTQYLKPSWAVQLTRKLGNLFWHSTKQKIKATGIHSGINCPSSNLFIIFNVFSNCRNMYSSGRRAVAERWKDEIEREIHTIVLVFTALSPLPDLLIREHFQNIFQLFIVLFILVINVFLWFVYLKTGGSH